MKNLVLIFVAFALLFSSCIKEDENSCPTPTISAYESGNQVVFDNLVNSSNEYGFFEIEYGPNGFSLGSGIVVEIIDDFYTTLPNGAHDVYIRGNCGGDNWSDWSRPTSFLVQNGQAPSACDQPYNFSYWGYNDELNWYGDYNTNYYEIEIGVTGFTLGSGTKGTSNISSYNAPGLSTNTIYDVYVRANCGGSDWTDWAGPFSFVAE